MCNPDPLFLIDCPVAAISHETALAEANARALRSGRRQRVERCRLTPADIFTDKFCTCAGWLVTEVSGPR